MVEPLHFFRVADTNINFTARTAGDDIACGTTADGSNIDGGSPDGVSCGNQVLDRIGNGMNRTGPFARSEAGVRLEPPRGKGKYTHPLPLVDIVHDLTERGIGLKVLTGQGAAIDTTTASGKLVFGIFAALAEFERELISERTLAGLASARACGRNGGRPYKTTPAKLRLALASMGQPNTKVSDLCAELGITRQTLYRHVSPTGELRPDGEKLLSR